MKIITILLISILTYTSITYANEINSNIHDFPGEYELTSTTKDGDGQPHCKEKIEVALYRDLSKIVIIDSALINEYRHGLGRSNTWSTARKKCKQVDQAVAEESRCETFKGHTAIERSTMFFFGYLHNTRKLQLKRKDLSKLVVQYHENYYPWKWKAGEDYKCVYKRVN